MELSQMSSEMLLFTYSGTLSQIDGLYMQKKNIEKEISARNETLKQKFQAGKIKLERDDTE